MGGGNGNRPGGALRQGHRHRRGQAHPAGGRGTGPDSRRLRCRRRVPRQRRAAGARTQLHRLVAGRGAGARGRPRQLQPQLHQPLRQVRVVPHPGGNRTGPRDRAVRGFPVHRRIRPDLHAPGLLPPGRPGGGHCGDGRHRAAAGARRHARPAPDRRTGHAGELRTAAPSSRPPRTSPPGTSPPPRRAAASTPWAGSSGSGAAPRRSDPPSTAPQLELRSDLAGSGRDAGGFASPPGRC